MNVHFDLNVLPWKTSFNPNTIENCSKDPYRTSNHKLLIKHKANTKKHGGTGIGNLNIKVFLKTARLHH